MYKSLIDRSDPTKVKVGHQSILPQEKNLVKLFWGQARPMVSGDQSAVREEPLDIGRTGRGGEVAADDPKQSLSCLVIGGGALFVVFPEPVFCIQYI